MLIYSSLKTPTLDRFARVIHVSTALSVIACLVMSFSGFLTFTDRTQAYVYPSSSSNALLSWFWDSFFVCVIRNILNNFPNDDVVINIARVCFGLNMFTTLPLEAFVCREVSPLLPKHPPPFLFSFISWDDFFFRFCGRPWIFWFFLQTIETFFYNDKPFDQSRHILCTTLLVGSGLIS